MKITIPKKHTLDGSKGKFLGIVGSEVRLACTTKCAKSGVIRVGVEETLEGSFLVNNMARQPVNEKNSSKKNFVPKFEWHRGMR
jgi:tartrate dehydratase alpha subunit/fumarate hydratase class I-like protein